MRAAVIVLSSKNPRRAREVVAGDSASDAPAIAPSQTTVTASQSDSFDRIHSDAAARGLGVIDLRASRESYAKNVRAGLAQATAERFTHAITMDLDRRHQSADLPAFVSAIERSPAAIINGYRALPLGRLPVSVRIARGNGDLWIGCAAWHWMSDAAWGFRAYPLGPLTPSPGTPGEGGGEGSAEHRERFANLESESNASGSEVPSSSSATSAVAAELSPYPFSGYRERDNAIRVTDLSLKSRGHEVDVELFAKSIWAGAKTVSLPVTIAADSSPQVMSPGEFVRFGVAITSLVMQRLLLPPAVLVSINRNEIARLPWPQRVSHLMRTAAMHHARQPIAFAGGVSVGVFFGVAPVWGFQILLATGVAHVLGLSKRLVIASTTISSPLTIPFILYASLLIGHAIARGQMAALPRPSAMTFAAVWPFLGEYVLGAFVLATAAGTAAGTIAYAAARLMKSAAVRNEARSLK